MKAIRVRYTVEADYVETNKERVRAVMAALRNKRVSTVKYSCHLEGDGRTFVHLAQLANPDDNPIPELPEFAEFRAGLKGKVEGPPQSEEWEIVGSNFDIDSKMSAGDICHFEIPVEDFDRAKRFYGELFGWQFHMDEKSNYLLFETPGSLVAGGMFQPGEHMPKAVVDYMLVDSIDETAALLESLGGKALSPKIDVPEHGTLMQVEDSEGNLIAIWEGVSNS